LAADDGTCVLNGGKELNLKYHKKKTERGKKTRNRKGYCQYRERYCKRRKKDVQTGNKKRHGERDPRLEIGQVQT